MSESTQLGANSGEGLRQRPSTTTSAGASTDIPEDMAYSTLRNKSRPVLATAISRAAAAAAAAAASTSSSSNHNQSNTTCGRFLSGGQFMNNRELRRYRNRIVIFLAIVAIYTTYIYESGMCVL
jgi:hypothetical protein